MSWCKTASVIAEARLHLYSDLLLSALEDVAAFCDICLMIRFIWLLIYFCSEMLMEMERQWLTTWCLLVSLHLANDDSKLTSNPVSYQKWYWSTKRHIVSAYDIFCTHSFMYSLKKMNHAVFLKICRCFMPLVLGSGRCATCPPLEKSLAQRFTLFFHIICVW